MLLREDVWPVTSHVGVDDAGVHVVDDDVGAVVLVEALLLDPGANCTKLDLLGKSILGDYFKESRTSKRPFLLLRINFPGRPIFIQFVPGERAEGDLAHAVAAVGVALLGPAAVLGGGDEALDEGVDILHRQVRAASGELLFPGRIFGQHCQQPGHARHVNHPRTCT